MIYIIITRRKCLIRRHSIQPTARRTRKARTVNNNTKNDHVADEHHNHTSRVQILQKINKAVH